MWTIADSHILFNLPIFRPGSSLAGVACHAQRETRERDTCLHTSKWSVTKAHLRVAAGLGLLCRADSRGAL